MNINKRALKSIIAVVLFIVVIEVYLFLLKEYLIAAFLLIIILSLWFIASFIFNRQIASLYFEKEIMNYLKLNAGQATLDMLFDHLYTQSGKQEKETMLEVINYSAERLQKKKKVILEGRILKCT